MNQRGGGGCCIARYAAGNGGAYDMSSKVERVMLRFRPIAPKPANNNNDSNCNNTSNSSRGGSSGGSPTTFRKRTRGRRKKATGQNMDRGDRVLVGSKRKRKPSVSSPENGAAEKRPFKTLSFIPEKPDVLRRRNCSPSSSTSSPSSTTSSSSPLWLSFTNCGGSVPAARHVAVGSWVKVERVTDTWTTTHWDSAGQRAGVPLAGLTDHERVIRLDGDTCPGFVTDGVFAVRWANAAYKKMVAGDASVEVVAWVVMEEGVVVPAGCVGFTCRVRVVTSGGGKDKNNNKTVPCDVWKMDGGGFAWRLDTTAALSLWVGSS